MSSIQPQSFSLYSLSDDDSFEGDKVTKFFEMIVSPDKCGKKTEYPFHERLQIGENVRVHVPATVIQKLKITVVEKVDGKEKKCSPQIELPSHEVNEIENTSEYQSIRLLLIVQFERNNFSFPIEGCLGQRPAKGDRVPQGSKVVLFSKAKIPNSPIKKRLKAMGDYRMSFVFLVNERVVRDTSERMVRVITDKDSGIEMRRRRNKRTSRRARKEEHSLQYFSNSEVHGLAPSTSSDDNNNNDIIMGEDESINSLIVVGNNKIDNNNYMNSSNGNQVNNKKRNLDNILMEREPLDNIKTKLRDLIDSLLQEEEQVQYFMNAFSSQGFTAKQLAKIVRLLEPLEEKEDKVSVHNSLPE